MSETRPVQTRVQKLAVHRDHSVSGQHKLHPDQCLVEIKGRSYSLRDAMRYQAESLVIGIFMTFFDVDTNRIPYPGSISYTELEPVDTYNHPMLDVEKSVAGELLFRPRFLRIPRGERLRQGRVRSRPNTTSCCNET